MTSSMRVWFAAFIVAVFVAGTSIGVIVDRVWLLPRRPLETRPLVVAGQRRPFAESAASRVADANLMRLRNRLDLTASQYESVRPIVEAWLSRVTALQANTREQLLAETDRFEEELSAVLTPAQRERMAAARNALLVPATGRGRQAGPAEGRNGRPGPGRTGPGRPGGPGRE